MENHRINNTLNLQFSREGKSKKSYREQQLERFKEAFYRFTKLKFPKDEDVVNAGFLYPIDHLEFIVYFMDTWVKWKERILDRLPKGTQEYADAFGKRGFTFSEFKLVTSGKVKEEHFHRYRVFDYLYLDDQGERDYFTSEHTDDEKEPIERYVDALTKWIKAEISVLNQFFFETKIPLFLPIRGLKKHTYILSQSGTGKSELLKIMFYDLQRRSQKRRSKSLVLLEPHHDLCLETVSFVLNKGKNRERVVYLDPYIRDTMRSLFGKDLLGADYTFVMNPFELNQRSDKAVNYLTEELSSAFFEIVKSEETFQMEAIIEACVEVLLRKGNASISDLKRFMDNRENEDLVELGKQIPNVERQKLMRLRFKDDTRLNATKSGIYYRLQGLLGNADFRRLMVGKSTVDLEKEINSGKVVICNVSKGSRIGKKSAPAFGKLLVALILGYVRKRQDISRKLRKTTFFFIDEFQNYVTPSIEEVMAESRKFGLHMVLSHQVMGQNMSTAARRVISGNTAIKIAGDAEPDSLKWMSDQMKGLTPKHFEDLPEYSFFINNKFNKKAGTYQFKVPDFLVEQKPPFYMSRQELKAFFLYMVHESGYYKKVEPEVIHPIPPVNPKYDHDKPGEGNPPIYKHDFDE